MRSGTTIAQYEIGEQLGQGGMGVVYKAQDTKLGRSVALKFLSRQLSDNEEARQRFVREARSASALDHANICTIYDIGETDDGEMFMAMAFYDGQTLKYRLATEDFHVDRSVDILRQLASALKRAHGAGIVHRDLKPANVMVSDDGEVKLLDFGLAKMTVGMDLTVEGSTVGTIGYMSPEQARGEEVTPASDVWALGVLGYELLAGKKPFGGEYEQAMIYTILNEEPPPIDEVNPDVPHALVEVINRALAKNVADRYQDGSEALAALERVVADLAKSAYESTSVSGTAPAGPEPSASTPSASALAGSAAEIAVSRRRTRRMALVASIAAVIVVVLAVAVARSINGGSSADATSVSADVIAVFPFGTRGSAEVAEWGEGLVTLISDKLDGAGSLRSVDPRAVIGVSKAGSRDRGNLEETTGFARRLGAGRFVTGDVIQAGSELRITADLRSSVGDGIGGASPGAVIESATVSGSASDMLDLVDQLTAELLAGTLAGPNARLLKTAALTSSSLEATKEFLRGEQLHREGLYREAAAAYNRAIDIDSTFALAHYKKSIVNDYTDESDDYDAAVKAVAYSGDLSTRDQALIKALMDKRSGRHHAAEQAYRTHVLRYPDEVDALQQIGEILFHDNPRRARPIQESRPWFDRVLQLEPDNIEARLHIARLDALDLRFDELKNHAAFFNEVAPNSERSVEVDAALAYGIGDSVLQAKVLDELREGPWYFYAYAAMSSLQYARNPIGALDILDPYSGNDGLMSEIRTHVDVITGKHNAVRGFLSDGRRIHNATWDVVDASLIGTRSFEVDDRVVRSVLDRLQAIEDPAERRRTALVPLHDIVSVEVTEFERQWHIGQLHILLGEQQEARRILTRIRQTPPLTAMGTVQADAALALEAEILYSEGDRQGALEVLRRQVYDAPGPALWMMFSDGTRARFLRAELELEIGDVETAKALYQGFHGAYSAYDRIYVAVAYERLGRIAEIQDDLDAAIYNYGKFVETWRDCDPELIPVREAARDRLDALLNRRARESAN